MPNKKSPSPFPGAKPQRKRQTKSAAPQPVSAHSIDDPLDIPDPDCSDNTDAELDDALALVAEPPPPPPDPGSKPLRNPRHETFARLLAEGLSATDAYPRAFPHGSRNRVPSHAYTLRARPEIAARITWLQTQAATDSIMDLREILRFLTDVKRTPIGKVTADSELAERFEETTTGAKKIWMPDKRACVELFAKLQGMLVDRAKVQHGGEIEHTIALSETLRADLLERRQRALAALPPVDPSLPAS